jgi:hypothetical protein
MKALETKHLLNPKPGDHFALDEQNTEEDAEHKDDQQILARLYSLRLLDNSVFFNRKHDNASKRIKARAEE